MDLNNYFSKVMMCSCTTWKKVYPSILIITYLAQFNGQDGAKRNVIMIAKLRYVELKNKKMKVLVLSPKKQFHMLYFLETAYKKDLCITLF